MINLMLLIMHLNMNIYIYSQVKNVWFNCTYLVTEIIDTSTLVAEDHSSDSSQWLTGYKIRHYKLSVHEK